MGTCDDRVSAAVLRTAALALCAISMFLLIGPATGQPRPRLTVWLATSFTPQADEIQRRLVNDWAASKAVDVTFVQEATRVLEAQVNAAIETKTLPDIVFASPRWTSKLRRLRLSLDVSDIVEKLRPRMNDSAVLAVQHEGKAFFVPTYGITEALYVRKDLLDAKGLKPPQTWDEMVLVAKALTERGKVWGYGASMGTPSYDAEIASLSMLAMYGASPYAADGKTPNLNNAGTRRVLAFMKEMWDAGAIPPDAVTWDDSGNNRAYLTQTSAIVWNTGSILAAMRRDNPDLLARTLIMPVPRGPRERVLIGYVYGLIISSTTKAPDAARGLVQYLVDPAQLRQIAEAAGTNFIPMYRDLAALPMWRIPDNAMFLNQLKFTHAIGYPGPESEWAQEAWRLHTLTELINRVAVNKESPDAAIRDTEAKLVQLYQQLSR